MRYGIAALIALVLAILGWSPAVAQQSTSGPVPPPGIDRGIMEPTRSQVLIPAVPKYIWHHGCGPTAVGMVVGYWDGNGFSDLVPGDASTQTAEVNTMMANDDGDPICNYADPNHFQDYSCPKDYSPSPLIADLSEIGGAHADNCVGDFMYTSRSAHNNYYGWSWASHVPRSFTEYVDQVRPGLNPQAEIHYFNSDLWDVYQNEIDAGRPVVLLVDTDGDGGTDHFVTGIGYDDATMKYAVHDTWDMSVHWYLWRPVVNGSTWGIYDLTTFSLQAEPNVLSVFPSQYQNNVPANANLEIAFDLDMDEATFNNSTFAVNGSLTGRREGIFGYNGPSRTIVFDPVEDFIAGEVVTVTVTTGVQTPSGYSLSSPLVWSFTIVTAGGGFFVHDSDYATADGPKGVCAADFNGDGNTDLATVGTLNVSIFLGQGNGSFATAVDHVIDPMYGFGLAPGDLDLDGDIDLTVSVESSEYMPFILTLLNNGDGTFVSSMLYPSIDSRSRPIIVDLNGDGAPDLAKVIGGASQVGVFINNGDGTFAAQQTYSAATMPYALCAGDIDRDYDFDLAVAAIQSDDISTLSNNGDGTFAAAISHSNAWNGYDICAADFNGDGHIDLANASEDGEYMGYVHVLLNNEDGSFDLDEAHYVGGSALTMAAGDLDGDGDIDISLGSEHDEVYLLTNDGAGTLTEPIDFPHGTYPHPICLGDFNNDGTLDMAKSVYAADSLKIYLNYTYLCGDANGDEALNIGDAVYLIGYIFKGANEPDPLEKADPNCDGAVNVGDVVYLVNFVFRGGPDPCALCP